MPVTRPAFSLSLPAARAVALAAQGLLPPAPAKSVEEVVARHGFLRTLGGVDAYLAVRARRPGTSRGAVDEASAAGRIRVSPAARGCMYVVPAEAVGLGLRVAEALTRGRDEREQAKAGIRAGEVEELAQAVRETLAARGPLPTDALRRALPEGSVRALGEAGKKVGISSPLPAALRRLEFDGEAERVVESGRLDSERYLWRIAATSPFAGRRLPEESVALFTVLGEIFFRAAGLATVAQFADWCGCAKRDAAAAVARLELIPVAVAEDAEVHLASPEHRALLADPPSAPAQVALLPFEDNALALHGGAAFLADPAHHGRQVPSWGRAKAMSLGEAAHLSFRSIVAGGELAGFWELDPERGELVTCLLGARSRALAGRIGEEATGLRAFLTEELGHARSFSLDTDADLARRSAALRSLARC